MAEHHSISIIGAGNVAKELVFRLENAGHTLQYIVSKSDQSAKEIAEKSYSVEAIAASEIEQFDSDFVIICTQDKFIRDVLYQYTFSEKTIVLHTSGAVGLDVFEGLVEHFGVLYPVQTFNKTIRNEYDVPFCIEANSEWVNKKVKALALTISDRVFAYSSEERQVLHVAAVFGSNFMNRLVAISKDLCNEHNLDFEILKPLLSETVYRSMEFDSDEMLSGPAKRKDVDTLRNHNKFLEDYPDYQKLYQSFTDLIIAQFHK